eukprot:13379311-Alexandrium_andersonii.AAC.1
MGRRTHRAAGPCGQGSPLSPQAPPGRSLSQRSPGLRAGSRRRRAKARSLELRALSLGARRPPR